MIGTKAAAALLSCALLGGCLGSSDVQLIGSADAAYPLPDGTALYLYKPVAALTDRQRSVMTEADVDILGEAGRLPIDRASGEHAPRDGASFQPYVLRRAGHCYQVQGADDAVGYVSFAHVFDAVFVATISDGERGCLEAGEAGALDVGVVEVTPESILPVATADLDMDDWATKLDPKQRAGYGITLDDSGEPEFRTLAPYRAYLRSLRGELAVAPDVVRWLAEPPTPAQMAAAHLVVQADRRLAVRSNARSE